MSIQAIIVDDMRLARDRVKRCLQQESEIQIIRECKNGQEAVEAIQTLSPDLVFLDVQMPKISGFDVVQMIGVERMPTVIFITAYDEFALQAFEVNAIDYLLKPFDDNRFKQALERAKSLIKMKHSTVFDNRLEKLLQEVAREKRYLQRIMVKSTIHTILVPVNDIKWIGAEGNYVMLHVDKETHLIREKISVLEQNLDPDNFARIHRSTIINLNRIRALYPLFNGDHLVVLQDGTELNMSRTFYEKLLPRLSAK